MGEFADDAIERDLDDFINEIHSDTTENKEINELLYGDFIADIGDRD